MKYVGRSILTPIGFLALSGCAIDALTLDAAGQVTLSANSVVAQSNAALDNIARHRQSAAEALIASDASCPPTSEIYIFLPTGSPDPRAQLPPLCASGRDDRRPGYRTVPLLFTSVSAERLKPTVSMIAAIAEYGEAYKKIADRPKTDVSAILASAAQKAADAKTIADAILPEDLPAVPNLETKQAKTAAALLQFLVDLAEEARDAKDIQKVFRDRSAKIDAILTELDGQLVDWTNATTLSYADVEIEALRRGYRNERERLSYEGRRAFLDLIQKADTEKNGIKRTAATLSKGIAELKTANEQLGNLVRGTLTPEQRAAEAKLNEQRLLRALKLSFEAATSWGVI